MLNSSFVLCYFLQQSCCYPASPWTPKQSKMAQPDLDYVAPDVQLMQSAGAQAIPACDVYSLGQLVCAIYNDGKSLIQAGHNVTAYNRQFEQVTPYHTTPFNNHLYNW